MIPISPKVGELLIRTTKAKDIDDAIRRVLTEYVELKLSSLEEVISSFELKWGMGFEAFKKKMADNALEGDSYSFDVEQDFWRWEEAETLKRHYGPLMVQ